MLLLIWVWLTKFGIVVVSGDSMNPTYSNEDQMIMLRTHAVRNGDTVAIYSTTMNELLCKRVIGVSGDVVKINKGELSVNDIILSEPYIKENVWGQDIDNFSVVVPQNFVFVMGDNRNNSMDSRNLGCISSNYIQGKILLDVTRLTGLKDDSIRVIVYISIFILLILILLSSLIEWFRNHRQTKQNVEQ